MEARYTGQADVELSASGAYQAKLLGTRLTKETLDAIVSSDLRRTRATAQAIAHYHGLPVWEDADLREFALGAWEEVSFAEVKARDGARQEHRCATACYMHSNAGRKHIQKELCCG